MSDDRPASGPRRYVPVPGVIDPDLAAEPEGPPPDPFAAPDLRAAEQADLAAEAPLPPPPGVTAPPDATDSTASAWLDDLPAIEPELAEPERSEPPPVATVPVPAMAAEAAPGAAAGETPTGEPGAELDDAELDDAELDDAGREALVPSPEVVAEARAETRTRARDLGQLVVRYGKAHLPEREPRAPHVDTGPPKLKGRLGQIIPVLRVVPWLLGGVFAFSFVWDFPGAAVSVFGQSVSAEGLLRVLSVSGLIGFLTNWLAITMLFQPREKRAILPQGLIPAQRERVIYRLSEAISRELINADIIKAKIQESGAIARYRDLALGVVRGVVEDPAFRRDLREIAGGYVHDVLQRPDLRRELSRLAADKLEESAGQGFGGAVLKLYRSVAEDDFQKRIDRALDEIPGSVEPLLDRIDVALDAVPPKIEARSEDIEAFATQAVLGFVEQLDIRSMIVEKARGFDEGQLESLLKSTSNEQLNYIKYLGALLGVFGGLVIWQPVGALVVYTAFGLGLWGLDEALTRARRRTA